MAIDYNCTGCGVDLYDEIISTQSLTVCPKCGATLDASSVHMARLMARLKLIFGFGAGVAVLVGGLTIGFSDGLDLEKGLIFGGSAGLLVVFGFALYYFIRK